MEMPSHGTYYQGLNGRASLFGHISKINYEKIIPSVLPTVGWSVGPPARLSVLLCACVCLSDRLSVCLFVDLSVCPSVRSSVRLPANLIVLLSATVCLSVRLSVNLSICLTVCLAACLSVRLFVRLSAC
jgi:hypothetical protein